MVVDLDGLVFALLGRHDDEIIDLNPCEGVELPTATPSTERYLTDGEVDRLFFHFDDVYRMLVELLLGTGMRVSEAVGLHWSRVDLDRGVVQVVEQWDRHTRMIKSYPKGKRARTVPLLDDTHALLVKWRSLHPPAETCGQPHTADQAARARAGRAGRDYSSTACRSGLVLTGSRGMPLDPHNFKNRQWDTAVDLAGIGQVRVHTPGLAGY